MKKVYCTFLFLFLTSICFAQGISVQGIARDAAGSAMTNKSLTFTFIIAKGNAAPIFTENQAITTDLFGVFSHIVGTGNATGATFSTIDFSLNDLRLKFTDLLLAVDVKLYDNIKDLLDELVDCLTESIFNEGINLSHNPKYLKSIDKGVVPFEMEILDEKARANEYLLTSLRTKWGCDLNLLWQLHGYDLQKERSGEIEKLIADRKIYSLKLCRLKKRRGSFVG